ncbi:HalOD1 output domain-containing protein [Natronomonas amylolytica]|uniref:HalOD1 output domain-containing protein n=1 Tax=Natronomonas amylolytica TaxID=3108498 RepID=UPI00300B5AE6
MVATKAGVELKSFEQTREADACQAQYDPESMPASMAVIATLSELTGRCPTDLRPLHEVVDTDALNEVFCNDGSSDGDIAVTFSLAGHTVTVNALGRIAITKSNGTAPAAPDGEDPHE